MNELMIFNNPKFGNIRTITEDGRTLFCGSDVAKALGYKNPSKALSDHCKGVTKRYTPTKSGEQEMNFIPEGDIYRLAAKSELPGADDFERWIFDEVLPSIRKTGAYSTNVLTDGAKAALAEAKAKNARARVASMWLKLAKENPIPEYKAICSHYASAELTGGQAVLPLPETGERTYSAAEVGELLGGISANMVGRIANQNGLKTKEYAIQVWDKSPHSAKQVPTWRYTESAVSRFRELLQ